MSVRRLIAATALSAGVMIAVPGVAAAQSPAEVLPTQVQRAPAPVARTGQDTMPMVYVGAGLAAAGAVIVVAARKRRDSLVPA